MSEHNLSLQHALGAMRDLTTSDDIKPSAVLKILRKLPRETATDLSDVIIDYIDARDRNETPNLMELFRAKFGPDSTTDAAIDLIELIEEMDADIISNIKMFL